MSIRFVVRQLGLLTMVLSAAIFAVVVWSAVDWSRGDPAEAAALRALAMTMGCGLAAGLLMWVVGRRGREDLLGRREALLLVALSWLVGAALAALPFRLWAMIGPGVAADHPFHSYINCYFEAMSGLTTTGATVLSAIAPVPRGLLLWRALTHWLGGLGIVVLFVAVLPSVGIGGKRLFQVEAPGPTQQGVRPRIAETARVLWMIYLGLTVAEVLMLRVL
ncbi:MAG: potassium transporter TrkG, partial [Phycisphaeraceae bacterium]